MSNKNSDQESHRTHVAALTALCAFSKPLDILQSDLEPFGWDHEEELVVLTRQHVAALLTGWSTGQLNSDALAAWAEAVEAREDIGREPDDEALLNDDLFELSSPEINGVLTMGRAQEMIAALAD